MIEKKQQSFKPPQLLRGLFSLILLFTSLILFAAWAIINYQVERLVATRTSEYAHSIARIAANSSAEALLSDDKIQLKMLVENISKDPYVRSATIFAEDGQVVVKHPEEKLDPSNTTNTETPQSENMTVDAGFSQTNSSTEQEADLELAQDIAQDQTKANLNNLDNGILANNLAAKTRAYVESQTDKPFIEPIIYQQVTAGWFKISLNRELLESSFRTSLSRSQNIIISIAAVLMALLLLISFRYEKRVIDLVNLCHRLIQINAQQIPRNDQQWMSAIRELSETQFQSLTALTSIPKETLQWTSSQRVDNTLFCYCQFAMQEQDDEYTASSLSQAEQYLKAAVQAQGVQSQGEVLSGCLIPFLDQHSEKESISDAFNLIHLIQELFSSITSEIKVKTFIGKGTMLVLENERAIITGISLSNRLHNTINCLSPVTNFGDVICLGLTAEQLNSVGEFEEIVINQTTTQETFLRLNSVSEQIKQQTSRKINFIKANYSVS